MFHVIFCIFVGYFYVSVVDQLPRLGKRELICLLLFTCTYVVSVRRGLLLLWVLGMGCVLLLWHSLSLPYNYLAIERGLKIKQTKQKNVQNSSVTTQANQHICKSLPLLKNLPSSYKTCLDSQAGGFMWKICGKFSPIINY